MTDTPAINKQLKDALKKAEELKKELQVVRETLDKAMEMGVNEFYDTDDADEKNKIFFKFNFVEGKRGLVVQCQKEIDEICENLYAAENLERRMKSGVQ